MTFRWARLGLLGFCIVVTSVLVYLISIRSPLTAHKPSSPSTLSQADAGIDQFTYRQSHAGTVQWEVKAEHGRIFESDNRAVLKDVLVTLYDDDGKEMTVAADHGTINTETSDFELVKHSGPIAIRTKDGYTIYTNHLQWVNARRQLSTDDPVQITGHGVLVTGEGLRGNIDREQFTVLENVRLQR